MSNLGGASLNPLWPIRDWGMWLEPIRAMATKG